jgi:hypothetical protein
MNDSRTRVDEAIDRAVRDLMRREPPAGFRARVLSRLEAPRRRFAVWPALATATGVLAVAAIGTLLLREVRVDTPPAAAPVSVSQSAPPPRPEAAPPSQAVGAPPVDPPARRAPRAEPIRTATFPPRDDRVSATSLAPTRSEPAEAMPPPVLDETESFLPSPSRIDVRPLTSPTPIDIAPIIIPPLHIPRMQPASPPR